LLCLVLEPAVSAPLLLSSASAPPKLHISFGLARNHPLIILLVPIIVVFLIVVLIVERKVHLKGLSADDLQLKVTLTAPDLGAHLWFLDADSTIAVRAICFGHLRPPFLD
jgi:hypothetical protein